MKGNQFYTIFGIVAAVLVVASGFYCYTSYSKYKAAGGEFDSRRRAIVRLKKGQPYPNEENLNTISKDVAGFDQAVKGLFQLLDRFQQPLNTDVDDKQFPQALKEKLAAFKALANEKGVAITEEEEFYMAMDAYKSGIPNPKAVPLLDFQLGAIEHLLQLLVESGATELISLNRQLLPVELSGGDAEEGAQADSSVVAAKYPVSLTFATKHPAFIKLVNSITNDGKYFFIVRALRVDNSSKEGAPKGQESENQGLSYVDANGEQAPPELIAQIPPDMEVEDQVQWMLNKGFEVQSSDARILLGDETLRVFMVVDVVRFANAEAAAAAAEEGGSGGGDDKGDEGEKKK